MIVQGKKLTKNLHLQKSDSEIGNKVVALVSKVRTANTHLDHKTSVSNQQWKVVLKCNPQCAMDRMAIKYFPIATQLHDDMFSHNSS